MRILAIVIVIAMFTVFAATVSANGGHMGYVVEHNLCPDMLSNKG